MKIFIAILAIIGLVLNVQKRWQGYAVWLFTNAFWVYHNCRLGEHEQAFLFLVMFGYSVYGIFAWRKLER